MAHSSFSLKLYGPVSWRPSVMATTGRFDGGFILDVRWLWLTVGVYVCWREREEGYVDGAAN